MRDFMYSVLGTLLGAWILERLPRLALVLVRLAARLMPTQELREQMQDDWSADIMTADGPLTALWAALSIILRVPFIRMSLGFKPLDFGSLIDWVFASNAKNSYITTALVIISLMLFTVQQASLVFGVNIPIISGYIIKTGELIEIVTVGIFTLALNFVTRKAYERWKEAQ